MTAPHFELGTWHVRSERTHLESVGFWSPPLEYFTILRGPAESHGLWESVGDGPIRATGSGSMH